ncbi:hypothetical protein ACQP3F_34065, partial [Escherichia coli]
SSGHLIFLFVKYGKPPWDYKILGLEGSPMTSRLAHLIFQMKYPRPRKHQQYMMTADIAKSLLQGDLL